MTFIPCSSSADFYFNRLEIEIIFLLAVAVIALGWTLERLIHLCRMIEGARAALSSVSR